MRRGEILVFGNGGDNIGAYMKGGTVRIEGNAGLAVGYWSRGGEIDIGGRYGSIFRPPGLDLGIETGFDCKVFNRGNPVS